MKSAGKLSAMKRALAKSTPQVNENEGRGQIEQEPDADDMPPASMPMPLAGRPTPLRATYGR